MRKSQTALHCGFIFKAGKACEMCFWPCFMYRFHVSGENNPCGVYQRFLCYVWQDLAVSMVFQRIRRELCFDSSDEFIFDCFSFLDSISLSYQLYIFWSQLIVLRRWPVSFKRRMPEGLPYCPLTPAGAVFRSSLWILSPCIPQIRICHSFHDASDIRI